MGRESGVNEGNIKLKLMRKEKFITVLICSAAKSRQEMGHGGAAGVQDKTFSGKEV